MSRIVFRKTFENALSLLEEDESVVAQNVWFNEFDSGAPKYMLLEINYTSVELYNATAEEFTA